MGKSKIDERKSMVFFHSCAKALCIGSEESSTTSFTLLDYRQWLELEASRSKEPISGEKETVANNGYEESITQTMLPKNGYEKVVTKNRYLGSITKKLLQLNLPK
jgi:hypothetical protein